MSRVTARQLAVLGLCAGLGCGPLPVFPGQPRHCTEGGPVHPAPSLGADPSPARLELPRLDDEGRPLVPARTFSYVFEREPSGTDVALRDAALVSSGAEALAVGDHGTVLARDAATGWHAESSGTEEDLYAVLPTAQRLRIAVGAHGAAVVGRAGAGWWAEDTGVAQDLRALVEVGDSVLAVGVGGVMVQRSREGVWRALESRTTEDLADVGYCSNGYVCAVGAHGTVVDCAQRADRLVCIPRAPHTDADLYAIVDESVIYGAHGVRLLRTPPPEGYWSPPPDWELMERDERLAPDDDVVAVASDLAVGRAGLVLVRSRRYVGYSRLKPPGMVRLPGGVDLHGVTFGLVDGYLVGDHGTIVRVGVEGVSLDSECEE